MPLITASVRNMQSFLAFLRTRRLIITAILILLIIPLILIIGIYLGDKNYKLTSTLVIICSILPFFLIYESRVPKIRELIILSILCALAAASRAAFYFIPQFKPILAIIIIAAVAFGAETGFLCGSVSMLLSNFLFGQGLWTPWQMFGCGLIGFIAGLLAHFRPFRSKWVLMIYGLFAGYLYGAVVDMWTVIFTTENVTISTVIAVYGGGFVFNTILAVATSVFLYFMTNPLLKKLERIKTKYGILG